jgi:hypothetical protein
MSQQSPAGPDGASLGQLIAALTEQATRLVRAEIALAKAELAAKAKEVGTGVGLFGAAGVIALYGVGALIATLILLLALVLPAWAAALIVTVVLFGTAAILVAVGRARLDRGGPATPETTVESIKADIATVKRSVTS